MLKYLLSGAFLRPLFVWPLLILCQSFRIAAYAQTETNEFKDKTVTFNVKNVPIVEIFRIIKQQTGVRSFMSEPTIRDMEEKVSLDAENERVEDVLTKLLCPRGYTFRFRDNTFSIPEKKQGAEQKLKKIERGAVYIPFTGTVENTDGMAVMGATVVRKGKNGGTTADTSGHFKFEQMEEGDTLVISAVGYNTKEVTVKSNKFDVKLLAKVNQLGETVVIAYGTVSIKNNTSNVATVKAADIARQPVTNSLLALVGRVPGLLIGQSTGIPGTGVTVRLQGINSLQHGNDPLYIIDGVPYPANKPYTLSNIQGFGGYNAAEIANVPAGAGSMMSFINPEDIESMDVLKDADATSIYGSRAANGVILITTKRGKQGPLIANVTMRYGWQEVSRRIRLLNTPQYLQMRKEAFINDGEAPPNAFSIPSQYNSDLTLYSQSGYTDWQKVLIGNTAGYMDLNSNVSGGKNGAAYFASVGYHRETSVFPGDFSDNRLSLHLSGSDTTMKGKLNMTFSLTVMKDDNELMANDLTVPSLTTAPNAPAIYQANGDLNWALLPNGNASWFNPFAFLHQKYQIDTYNAVGNMTLTYELFPGLSLRSSMGGIFFRAGEKLFMPLSADVPEKRTVQENKVTAAVGKIAAWIIEPQLVYKKNVGQGALEVLLGGAFHRSHSTRKEIESSGYRDEQHMENLSAATSSNTTGSSAVYAYAAAFCRLRYDWKDRYVVSLTGRRDGSSRFGEASRLHNFGAVGAAWIFSNEHWLRRNIPFVSLGKLKASYGTSGNDQIGDYEYVDIYDNVITQLPYQGVTGLMPGRLANPYLRWEEARKLSFGFELGLWPDKDLIDRCQIEGAFYHNRSFNQLMDHGVSTVTGFQSMARNIDAVIQNTGWEFIVTTVNISRKNVSWRTTANLTIPRNKLLSFPGLETSPYVNDYDIGQPVDIRRVFSFVGVDPETGYYLIRDKNGNVIPIGRSGTVNDRVVNINLWPEYYGGLENTFSIGSFVFNVSFSFVKQFGPAYWGDLHGQFYGAANNGNQPASAMQRWQKPGDIATIQKVGKGQSVDAQTAYMNWKESDAMYMDASYLRLKNAEVSWKVPERWTRRAHLRHIRMFFHGQNLLTLTRYKGLDPETKSSGSLPPLRVFTFGITASI